LGSIPEREHENLNVVRLEGRVASQNSEEARKVGDQGRASSIVQI